MKVNGDLDVFGEASGAFKEYADFPKNPKVGTWARINRMIMACTQMDDGTPIWLPMTPERDTHIHNQPTPSTDWILPHNLGSTEVIVQCYDNTGAVIIPSSITPMDDRSILVKFPQEVSGKAISMIGYTDGQSINAGALGSMYSDRGAPLFESIRTGYNAQTLFMALGKDGMIYMAGRNYHHSQGQGDGAPESAGGFNLIQLPYFRSKVKDYGSEWSSCYVLFENGELWGWGFNGNSLLGLGDSTTRKIPVKLADGVDEVIALKDTGYVWDNNSRRRIYKMKDGSYKVVGRADKLFGDGTELVANTPTDLRTPDGVAHADIKRVWLIGNYTRGCVYIETNDQRHFIMGNNAHGQLGIGEPRPNSIVDWNELPQFAGMTLENITSTDGWGNSNGQTARYLHFTNGEVYYSGEGYPGYFMTGNELEDLPMDVTLASTWTLIQTNVDEIHVTHAPCSVAMKQGGVWKQFGYSYEKQIEATSSRNVMTPIEVPNCPANAKLVSRLKSYTYAYNQPVIFLGDNNEIAIRAQCNYGIAMDGNGGRNLPEWEYRQFVMDKSPIKDAQINNPHDALHTLLFLLEDGSLYGIGYGGYNILSGSHGHVNQSTVAAWRRLN